MPVDDMDIGHTSSQTLTTYSARKIKSPVADRCQSTKIRPKTRMYDKTGNR